MPEASGAIGALVFFCSAVALIVLGILALFAPYFLWKIHDNCERMRRELEEIARLFVAANAEKLGENVRTQANIPVFAKGETQRCVCGTQNRNGMPRCVSCGALL